MSAATDRLNVVLGIALAASAAANAEVAEVERLIEEHLAAEAEDAARAEARAAQVAAAEAEAPVAPEPEAESAPKVNEFGPVQQSPEQLLAAEPTPEPEPEPEPVAAEVPPATPAAVAHAEALGVDLAQVEPTGGTDGNLITKGDVAAAATLPDPPVEETAADVNAPESAA